MWNVVSTKNKRLLKSSRADQFAINNDCSTQRTRASAPRSARPCPLRGRPIPRRPLSFFLRCQCTAHVRFRGQSGHHFLQCECLLLTRKRTCECCRAMSACGVKSGHWSFEWGECRRAQRMEAELGMPELLWLSRRRCLFVNYNPRHPRCPQLVTLGVLRLPVPLSWEPRNSQNIER